MELSALPTELLDQIAGYFIPTMHSDPHPNNPGPDIAACRRTLLLLARMNKRLNAVAVRHLYHTVFIDDLRRLFTFLGTIIFDDYLASRVRVLNIFTSLDAQDLDFHTGGQSELKIARITPNMKAYQYLGRCFGDFTHPRDLMRANCAEYPQSACALLLCLVEGMEHLYLRVPTWNLGDCRTLSDFFERSCRDSHLNFVPRLSSLSLIADPEIDNPTLGSGMPQHFLGSGAIRHLEIYGACLLIDEGGFDQPFLPARWSSLETVRLSLVCMSGH